MVDWNWVDSIWDRHFFGILVPSLFALLLTRSWMDDWVVRVDYTVALSILSNSAPCFMSSSAAAASPLARRILAAPMMA